MLRPLSKLQLVTVTLQEGKNIKDYISVNVISDDQITAYICIGVKTDDMVKEVFDLSQ